ncbi:hypothetical protein [Sphingomonas hylomeconis]|uniref:RNA polymerase subunit sigma-70 n=1 Tax=Sphingomonas hylomeconis TaxID=1395958 RepID=A0ABV7SY72_9SPHN|nr:hypothetical protein [Sphingomonas hylomeconis]
MTTPLPLPRFQELADAYGGVIARWPAAVRDAARVTAMHPVAAAILAQALLLDETLDAWQLAAPPARLRDAVLARAPDRTPDRTIVRSARLWWSGVGIAATLAGATAGIAAVAMLGPIDAPSDAVTSFGDIGAQES